jgi:succinoglycan biosynthesis protein ExoO
MNIAPEVSVIIPAYNTSAYISRAIESALTQTLKNIEIIIVDDASTDNTLAIAKSFTDPRLQVFTNSQNLGASTSRNVAINQASGRWIAVLDSDDWYAPERLERLVRLADCQGADIIADDLYLIKDDEECAWTTLIEQSGESISSIKHIDPVYFVDSDIYDRIGLHLGITKPLFKRQFLIDENIQYNPGLKVSEDFWLTLTCLVRGANFYLVPEPHYYYLARANSLVYSNKLLNLHQNCRAILDFLERERVTETSPQLAKSLAYKYKILKRHQDYFGFLDLLGRKQIWKAIVEIMTKSHIFIDICRKLPGIIDRRIQYYIFGNKTAFDIFSRQSQKPDRPSWSYAVKRVASKLK